MEPPAQTSKAAARRARKPKPEIDLPVLPPHHHTGLCSCEPSIAYLRVSSAGGRERIISPMMQFEEIVRDSLRNNRRIIDIYFDLKSGKSLKGRKLDTVIAEIKAGRYRLVSVYKWNRWGRNTLDSLEMCAAVAQAGGQVVSATEAFDTTTPTGEMIRDMLLIQAQWQSQIIGESWKSAQNLRRSNGLPHSGKERIGYVYIDRHYVVDPDEAAMVKDAYVRYSRNNVSLFELTRDWNAKGMVTALGSRWTPQALGKMLDTGFAAGFIRERSKPTGKPANKLANYDVWRKGVHDPIIDEELWQDYRARREAQAALPPRSRRAAHSLSTLLFCGVCGRRMVTKYMGAKRYHQWVCPHRAAYHPDQAVQIANSIVLPAVMDWVFKRAAQGDKRAAERAAMTTEEARAADATTPVSRSSVETILARIGAIKTRKERARDLYLDGSDPEFTRLKYDAKRAALDEEERGLRIELGRAKAAQLSADDGRELLPAFTALRDQWNEYLPSQQRDALQQVIGMVCVFPRPSRLRSQSALRIDIVPSWEMSTRGEAWLSERRR